MVHQDCVVISVQLGWLVQEDNRDSLDLKDCQEILVKLDLLDL